MANRQPMNRLPLKAESKMNGATSSIMTKTFPEQFERMLYIVNENVRLWESWNSRNEEMQSVINQTRNMWEFTQLETNNIRPCQRCPKLERRVGQLTELERRVRFQENLITELSSHANRLMKLVPKNHQSYRVLIQETNNLVKPVQVDDAITTIEKPTFQTKDSTTKEPDLAPELNESNTSKDEYADDSMIMKSPEGRPRLDSLERSPIVKRSVSKKRRLKCISTKKRNKLENGESIMNADSDLDELEVVSYSKSRLETPDMLDIKNDVAVVPYDKTEEVETTTVEEPSLTGMIDIVEPTQKVSTRRGRTNLTFGKPNLNEATIEQLPDEIEKTMIEKKSPLNVIISSKNNTTVNGSAFHSPDKRFKAIVDEEENLLFKNPDNGKKVIVNDEEEKSVFHNLDKYNKGRGNNETKQKTKWNLTKSRAPTNTKYKQTLLTTATLEKKTDLSTSEKFNGGLLPTTEMKKSGVNLSPMKICDKENTIEQTFNPTITSTANDLVAKSPVKIDKFAKYENNVADNSFDVIPKTSPNYKYRRDAVRKKSERRKLPGQVCDCCADYYCHLKDEVGETQAKMTMDKFSRHRDKFPIQAYTPEGFWNPVFDTNDKMLEMSRE